MATTASDLRRVALEEFASSGYHGTSLQLIADRAGVSKASVLYHYPSKEVLLEAALSPALDALEVIVNGVGQLRGRTSVREQFLAQFVDFLLEHRLAVHVFVNQSAALVDVPVAERARTQILRIARYFESTTGTVDETVRFGVALGGAAYLLAQAQLLDPSGFPSDDELRPALIRILGELLAPVPTA